MYKKLLIKKIEEDYKILGDWDSSVKESDIYEIKNYMGDEPIEMPQVKFKIGYNSSGIFLVFRVQEKNIIANAKKWHDNVWEDSCAEFFFSPEDFSGYFNVETNCCGVMLLRFQKEPYQNPVFLNLEMCEKVVKKSTFCGTIKSEIKEEKTWILEYYLPFFVLQSLADFRVPKSGSIWRGNFYKCADSCSTPHWLTWSIIKENKPNFHVPDFFGFLEFE